MLTCEQVRWSWEFLFVCDLYGYWIFFLVQHFYCLFKKCRILKCFSLSLTNWFSLLFYGYDMDVVRVSMIFNHSTAHCHFVTLCRINMLGTLLFLLCTYPTIKLTFLVERLLLPFSLNHQVTKWCAFTLWTNQTS